MRPVSHRSARQNGFVPVGTIELMLLLVIYSIYFAILLPLATRSQPPNSATWWAIVLGPFAVCLLAVSPYSVWCWRKGKDPTTFLHATMLVLGLEVLYGLFAVGATVWSRLT